MSDGPNLQLFSVCVVQLVTVPQRGVGATVTAKGGQVAHQEGP